MFSGLTASKAFLSCVEQPKKISGKSKRLLSRCCGPTAAAPCRLRSGATSSNQSSPLLSGPAPPRTSFGQSRHACSWIHNPASRLPLSAPFPPFFFGPPVRGVLIVCSTAGSRLHLARTRHQSLRFFSVLACLLEIGSCAPSATRLRSHIVRAWQSSTFSSSPIGLCVAPRWTQDTHKEWAE